jgi:glycosyltransferase involved in cell wall biosynthesis
MTIGIDARFLGPKGKGLGRYTQKLIEELEKIDSKDQYVIFLRQENWSEFEPKSSHFKKVLADFSWYSLAEQLVMPAKIYREGIDLMHFPHFNVPIFYFGPFVVTVHDLILRHFPTRRASTLGPMKYWLKNAAYRIVIWLAIKRAKKIIVPSNHVKKDILNNFGVDEEKIVVTYEGAPEGSSKLKVPAEGEARQRRQSSKLILNHYKINKPYLLYVGNAYPHKNLENLIEAFRILMEKYNQDLQLVLVGEEDYFYKRLRAETDAMLFSFRVFNRVVFAGFISDDNLSDLYREAKLYVFPSLCEGFGLPPLEAMAHGIPIVSSYATCLPEVLGEAAIYFDAASAEDMAEKINKVLTDKSLAEKLKIAGYEQIKKYSWQKMAKETLGIYGEIN